jgi:hypothetical protein
MKLINKASLLAGLICAILFIRSLISGHTKDAIFLGILGVMCVGISYILWRRRDAKRRKCLDMATQKALNLSKERGGIGFDPEEAFTYFQEFTGRDGVGDPDLSGHDIATLKGALAQYAAIARETGCAPSSYYKNRAIYPR